MVDCDGALSMFPRSRSQQSWQLGEVAGRHGEGEPGADAFNAALDGLDHAAHGLGPAEGFLDGLITNDKFCLTRRGRLVLTWWRRALRLRGEVQERAGILPDPESDRGGTDEASLAGPPAGAAGDGRSPAMGSGVHAHPGLEFVWQPADADGGGRPLPTSAGGEP